MFTAEDISRIVESPKKSALFIDTIDLSYTVENAGIKTNKELKSLFKPYITSKFKLDYVDCFIRGSYADLAYKYRREFLQIFFELFNGKILFIERRLVPHRDTYIVYDRNKKHEILETKTGIRKEPTDFHFDMFRYASDFISNAIHQKKFIAYMNKKYKCKFDKKNIDDKYAYLAKYVLLGADSSANHVRYTLACNVRSVQFDWCVFFRFVDLLEKVYGKKYLQGIIDDQIDRGVISKEYEINTTRAANLSSFAFIAHNI